MRVHSKHTRDDARKGEVGMGKLAERLLDEHCEEVESDLARDLPRFRGWSWPDEASRSYVEGRVILAHLEPHTLGWYRGVIDTMCWANGEHEDGLSRHRLPAMGYYGGEAEGEPIDLRVFQAVFDELDNDGQIFSQAYEVLYPYNDDHEFPESYVWLSCTESPRQPPEDDPRLARFETSPYVQIAALEKQEVKG